MGNVYFKSRTEAGIKLGNILAEKYRYEDCAVVALSDGGVLVGEPIATILHSILTLVVTEEVRLPGDSLVIGSATQGDVWAYNNALSTAEIAGYMDEFRGHIEQEKRIAREKINRLIGDGEAFNRDILQNRNIILTSDGIFTPAILGAAMEYLKPVKTKKTIVALPVASVKVVDWVHFNADEVHILDVKETEMGVDHYYEDNTVPKSDDLVKMLNNTILNWK